MCICKFFTHCCYEQFKADGRLLVEASLTVDPSLTLAVSAEDGRQVSSCDLGN
jgi:hypothetical protein